MELFSKSARPFLLISGMSNFQIKLPKEVTLTEMDGKLVLFSKKTGDFFGLNESGAFFIQRLLKSDFKETIKEAARTFSAPEQELQQDLTDLVKQLEGLGLLQKIPSS